MKYKIVEDGLVALWNAETWSEGTTWNDTIEGKKITFSSAPQSKSDDGIELTSAITFVSESLSSLNLSTPCTFEWIGRIDGNIANTRPGNVFGIADAVNNWDGGVHCYSKASPEGVLLDMAFSNKGIKSGVYDQNIEYHIIVKVDGETTTFYVNSTEAKGTSTLVKGYATKNYVYNSEGSGRFYGAISRMAFWNKSLSDEEIQTLFTIKTDENFYYGKYLLPEIPVLSDYPYAVILKNDESNFFRLAYSKNPWYFSQSSDSKGVYTSTSEKHKRYKLDFQESEKGNTEFAGQWVDTGESTNGLILDENITYQWANRDILDGSTSTSIVWVYGRESSTEPYDYLIYDSVEKIFNTGTNRLTRLINNSAYDDNSYTISNVPAWLKFNNIRVTKIYANGNSYIGVNSETGHINFNNRDTKMYYLWTEENKLYDYYNFYRIRWRGYSQYNNTGTSYLQDWEVVFFDTGDICIHAIKIPTSNYNGTNSIVASQTYSYTALTVENPFVSFYSLDENNTKFNKVQSIIELELPYDKKYLVRAGGKVYTITDGALVELSQTEITSDLFRASGVDEIPSGDLLKTLVDSEVLYWIDTNEHEIGKLKAKVKATPFAQTLYSQNYMMVHHSILGIQNVSVSTEGSVLFAVSVDAGVTYKYWTGTAWSDVSDTNLGMTAETMALISSDQWNELATTGTIKFRIIISGLESKFKSLVVNYINQI